MKFVIATDGRLAEEAASLVDRMAAPGDAIEVLTVVPVPKRLVGSIRPRARAESAGLVQSAGYLGVTGSGGADEIRRDSSHEDWEGDHTVITSYVDSQGAERQQELLTALRHRGRRPTAVSIAGERVVSTILGHLEQGECGVLVVGQHRGLLPGYLGHTPQRLVSEAPCPVLVVPIH